MVAPHNMHTPTKPSECRGRFLNDEFVIAYEVTADGYALHFFVIEHLGDDERKMFQKAGAPCKPTFADGLDDAEQLVRGCVKWDGCADFDIGDERQSPHRLHACGLRNARRIGRAIDLIYELAEKHIPHWDRHWAKYD